jgi:hypothetical protein
VKAHQNGNTVTLTMTTAEAQDLETELLWCRDDATHSKKAWEALNQLSTDTTT